MRRVLRWSGLALAVLILLHIANLAALHWRHYQAFGHFAPLDLHADHIFTKPELEGLSAVKLHSVQLANYGLLPRRIRVCHTLSDAMNPVSYFEMFPEQWEAHLQGWKPVSGYEDNKFCKAAPMTQFDGEIRWDWLLPGQELRQTAGVLFQHDAKSGALSFRLRVRINSDDSSTEGITTSGFTVERAPLRTE